MKRLRGILLRAARRRVVALVAGLALLAPALVVMIGEFAWESWATDGLALVLGGTGAALIVAGIGGSRPDWIDEG